MNATNNRLLLVRLGMLLGTALLLSLPAHADDWNQRRHPPRAAARGPAQPAPRGRVQLPAPGTAGFRAAPGGAQPQNWGTRTPPGASTGSNPNPAGGSRQQPGGQQTGGQQAGGHQPGGQPGWQGNQGYGNQGYGDRHDRDNDRGAYTGGAYGANHYPHRWLHPVPRALPRDYGQWSNGRWVHGDHYGYAGWWWVVGPSWYFYDSPYYPYPSPDVATTVVMEGDNDSDAVYADTAPAYDAGDAASSESGYWYCQDPQGYYPDVQSCNVEWTMVPASSQSSAAPAPQQAYWYYCQDPQGYYPTVQTCNTDWTPVQSSPPQTAPAGDSGQAPTSYWYYCQNPRGYYPTVGMCNTDWIPVPAHQ